MSPILQRQPLAKKATGFSMIELLVVMLIIAVLAAGVSLVVNPEGSTAKQLNKAGEQLYQQMNYARDEALVLNTSIGLDVVQDEDDLELAREVVWKRHTGFDDANLPVFGPMEHPLTRYELPDEFQWDIEVDGDALAINLDQLLEGGDDQSIPEILFEGSGDVTPFSITLFPGEALLQDNPDLQRQRYLITINERGELARYRVGEEAL